MPSKQQEVLELVTKFAPKDFGIEAVYYKTIDNGIAFLFIVKKDNAPSLVSYLNSLSAMIQKEIKGIQIESKIYVDKPMMDEMVKEEKLQMLTLSSLLDNATIYSR